MSSVFKFLLTSPAKIPGPAVASTTIGGGRDRREGGTWVLPHLCIQKLPKLQAETGRVRCGREKVRGALVQEFSAHIEECSEFLESSEKKWKP